MTSGEKIRKRRYELSVTRQELAKQLGHSSNYIANVELGYRILGERELEIVADYARNNRDRYNYCPNCGSLMENRL